MFPPLLIWHHHYSDGDDDDDDDDYVDDDDEEDDDDDEEQTKEKDEGVLGEPEIGDVRPADCRVHYCWGWKTLSLYVCGLGAWCFCGL